MLFFFFLQKLVDFCENLPIFAKIRRFLRKFTDFCKKMMRKSADLCENARIFVKIVNLQGGWVDTFLDFFWILAKTRKLAFFFFGLNFCENPQNGTQILRASFS